MFTPDEIKVILEQVAAGTASNEDIEILNHFSKSGEKISLQIGKFIINIGEGKGIKIGDIIGSSDGSFTYDKLDKEAIQALIQIFEKNKQAQAIGTHILKAVPIWLGREELVTQLQQHFFITAEPLSSNVARPKILILTGQGGIGKSSLATKLIEGIGVDLSSASILPSCPYEKVICLKAEDGSSFDEVAEFLIEALEVMPLQPLKAQGQKISRIVQGLQQKRCLLFIDELEAWLYPPKYSNAGLTKIPALGNLLHSLAYSNHQSQAIITSREIPANLADSHYENSLPDPTLICVKTLGGVSIEAGIEVLRQRKLEDSENDLRWVTEKVDGHLFLLTQLASLSKGKPGYLRKHPELVTQRAEPIFKEQLARQNEATLALLKRMSILRVGIDIRGLTFLRLYKDVWMSGKSDSSWEFSEFTQTDIKTTQNILDTLADCCLVECHYEQKRAELFYDLHRVTKEFLQSEYKEELPELFKNVYSFYRSRIKIGYYPRNINDLRPAIEAYFFSYKIGDYSEAFNLLDNKLSKQLMQWVYWTFIKETCEQLLAFVEQNEKVTCLLLMGDVCIEFGELEKAEECFQNALPIAALQNDKNNFEICNLKLKLIDNIRQADVLDEMSFNSKSQYKKLYPNSDELTGFNFLEFLADYNRQSAILNANTQRQMLEYQLQHYEDFIAEHGESDLADATFLTQIGETLVKLGEAEIDADNLEIAREILQKALRIVNYCRMMKHFALTNYHLARVEKLCHNKDLSQIYYKNACDMLQNLGAARELNIIQQKWQRMMDDSNI